MTHRLYRCAFIASVLLASCGREQPQDSGQRSIPLTVQLLDHLVQDAPAPSGLTIAREWTVERGVPEIPFEVSGATSTTITRTYAGLDGTRESRMDALSIDGGLDRRVTVRAEPALHDLTLLDVSSYYPVGDGPGAFHLSVDNAAGQTLFRSKKLRFNPSKVSRLTVCPLPKLDEAIGAIHLEWAEGEGTFLVSSIVARRGAIATMLPTADAPMHWPEDAIARPGVGLVPGVPLHARITVPSDATLSLALAWPSEVCAAKKPSSVSVTVKAVSENGEEHAQTDAMVPPRRGWGQMTMDLVAFGGKEVTVEVALDSEDGAAVIADGRIASSKGQAAPATVLLVTSDTHRADYLSIADPEFELATPIIDRLAREGAYFTNCSSTTNVTNPSHVAMMTGIHPRDTRVADNITPMRQGVSTLAQHFRDAGFLTLAVLSARHLGTGQSGLEQGFDQVYTPRRLVTDGAVTVDHALSWLDENQGRPVFLWIHLFDAHTPYAPPKKFEDKHLANGGHDRRLIEETLGFVPFWVPGTGIQYIEEPELLYRGEVEYIDELMGRILGVPRIDRAIVAFTSDHGESFGENNTWWDHATLTPSTLMVPLILRAPMIDPEVIHRPVQQLSLGHTLLRLAGLDASTFPGTDLLVAEDQVDEPRFAISAHGLSASITSGPWHLELYLRQMKVPAKGIEPYRSGETTLINLNDARPRPSRLDSEFERAKRMRKALIRWLSLVEGNGIATKALLLDTQGRIDMKALGYTSEGTEIEGAWWNPERAHPDWRDRFED